MRRRRSSESVHINHERWLVSYADFITLLFAFFVVMYSVSQVNEGKYRVLSDTLDRVFNQQLTDENLRSLVGDQPFTVIDFEGRSGGMIGEQGGVLAVDEEPPPLAPEFETLVESVEQALADFVTVGEVHVSGNETWLEIELPSSLLFSSGQAKLSQEAMVLLGGLIQRLKEQAVFSVRVEGHTDNVPIRSLSYPSNWHLSAARAASVVDLFLEEGIDPHRLAAVGYGEFQPVADNQTEDGRSRNRRVVLMISRNEPLRPTGLVEQPLAVKRLAPPQGEVVNGIRRIPLEGGGMLFTSEAADSGRALQLRELPPEDGDAAKATTSPSR